MTHQCPDIQGYPPVFLNFQVFVQRRPFPLRSCRSLPEGSLHKLEILIVYGGRTLATIANDLGGDSLADSAFQAAALVFLI
jgi:hypothetical protein